MNSLNTDALKLAAKNHNSWRLRQTGLGWRVLTTVSDKSDIITQRAGPTSLSQLFSCLCAAFLIGMMPAEAEEFKPEVVGDIGLAGYYSRSIIRGNHNVFSPVPYLDFEYARMFARVDTFGVKTLKMGYGHLELTGKISQDGFNTNTPSLTGLGKRETPVPVGIGTLQVTPLGGILINAFHDVNRSQGELFEVTYGGQLDLPGVTLHPLLGAEYQSKKYVRYYYGISSLEAARSQYAAYQPSGSVNGLIGLIAEIRLTDTYYLNCYVRHKWLGNAIQLSPIVSQGHIDSGYISLSYRFK